MSRSKSPAIVTEYRRASDESIRPKTCIACGDGEVFRRSYQFHDMQDLGSPLVRRILRHEKILWQCKKCGAQFMLVNPGVPYDTEYSDDVKAYVFKRVLDNGEAMNRVAADLRALHHVEVTPQAIAGWIKKERKNQGLPGDSPASPPSGRVLTLDGTFKAVRVKKNGVAAGAASGPYCLHLTRLKDGRLAAFWLPGSEREK